MISITVPYCKHTFIKRGMDSLQPLPVALPNISSCPSSNIQEPRIRFSSQFQPKPVAILPTVQPIKPCGICQSNQFKGSNEFLRRNQRILTTVSPRQTEYSAATISVATASNSASQSPQKRMRIDVSDDLEKVNHILAKSNEALLDEV